MESSSTETWESRTFLPMERTWIGEGVDRRGRGSESPWRGRGSESLWRVHGEDVDRRAHGEGREQEVWARDHPFPRKSYPWSGRGALLSRPEALLSHGVRPSFPTGSGSPFPARGSPFPRARSSPFPARRPPFPRRNGDPRCGWGRWRGWGVPRATRAKYPYISLSLPRFCPLALYSTLSSLPRFYPLALYSTLALLSRTLALLYSALASLTRRALPLRFPALLMGFPFP